jgi:hypothetical protein
MSISMTPHGERQQDNIGARVDALPMQIGDEIVIAIGANFTVLISGLYRMKALAACRMRIGAVGVAAGAIDATKGESWALGEKEVRFLTSGQIVKVAAP